MPLGFAFFVSFHTCAPCVGIRLPLGAQYGGAISQVTQSIFAIQLRYSGWDSVFLPQCSVYSYRVRTAVICFALDVSSCLEKRKRKEQVLIACRIRH